MSDGGSDNGGKTLRANSRGSRTFGSEDTWLGFGAGFGRGGRGCQGGKGYSESIMKATYQGRLGHSRVSMA